MLAVSCISSPQTNIEKSQGEVCLVLTWSNVGAVERLRHRVQSGLDPGEAWQDGARLAVGDVGQLQLIIGPADKDNFNNKEK